MEVSLVGGGSGIEDFKLQDQPFRLLFFPRKQVRVGRV